MNNTVDTKIRRTTRLIHETTQLRKNAGRAPSLRGIPWHLLYNWGKSTEKPLSGYQLCYANEDALTIYKRPYPRPCHSSGYGMQKDTLGVAGHVFFHRESQWASKSPRLSWPERENAESGVFAVSHFDVREANLTFIQRANNRWHGMKFRQIEDIYNCTV